VWKVELEEDSGKGSQPQGLRKIKRKLFGHQLCELVPLRQVMAGAKRGCPGYDTIIQENVNIILKTFGHVERCVQKAIATCKVQDSTVKLLGEMLEDLAHRRLMSKFWLESRRPERKKCIRNVKWKRRHIVGDLHNVACVLFVFTKFLLRVM
jgi:hypothetical protein